MDRLYFVSTLALLAVLINATPATASEPAKAPDYNWSGFYVGINAGVALNDSKWNGEEGFDGAGVIGGAQAGYNYQAGLFVLGIEGDVGAAGIDSDKQCLGIENSSCHTEQDFVGSVRARFGVTPIDRLLTYIDGGIAFTNYTFGESNPNSQTWNTGFRVGGTVGLGAEYAIRDHWLGGIEWNYYDFGDETGNSSSTAPPVSFRESENTVVVRVSYKF